MSIEDLIKKYQAGKTSLEEEKELFDRADISETGLGAWARYVQQTKVNQPTGMEDRLWKAVSQRTKILRLSVFAAAASILLVLGVLFTRDSPKKEMSYEEKKAKLEEAYAMIDNSKEIIYEDDIIILYTE